MYVRRSDVIELVKESDYNLAESIEDVWAMLEDVEKLPSVCPNDICWCKSCGYQFLYASDYPCCDCKNGDKYISNKEYDESIGK